MTLFSIKLQPHFGIQLVLFLLLISGVNGIQISHN
jgi:hypothetical protein